MTSSSSRWQEFAVAGPRYIAELVEIITVAAGLKTRAEQLVVALPLLHLDHQPGIVPRHRHVLHDRKAVEIVEAAGYKFVGALGALRWRRNHKAAAENIDRHVAIWPDLAVLTVMPIPGLEMTGACSGDQWCLSVTVKGVGKHTLVLGSQSSEVMPFRLPHMKPIDGALANLPAILLLATNPNPPYRLTIGRLLASTGNVATPCAA